MPAKPSPVVFVENLWPGNSSARRDSYYKLSWHHKPEWPRQNVQNPLTLRYIEPFPPFNLGKNVNGYDVNIDMANEYWYHKMNTDPWDARLYATAYDKFMSAARNGSAEVGMNAIQYRQSLAMLVKYTLLSLEATRAVRNTFKRGFEFLNRNPKITLTDVRWRLREAKAKAAASDPSSASYRRVKREIRLLDEITGAFLAYRYGLSPLMADITSVCEILSKEHNGDVVYRKAAMTGWGGYVDLGYQQDSFKGNERVVLTGRCRVTNPNLLLANRLGLINPQVWAWDAIPWSFVVDWWLPVGKFLSNLTASVGLEFVDSSVTRTREGSGSINVSVLVSHTPPNSIEWRHGQFRAKRKVREAGPIPMPFSVPYGTGLGLERGQNAVALLLQLFSKGVKGAQRADRAEGNA